MRRLLVLMAKQPAPTQTKTRLMPMLSAEQAAELYHCFLVDKVAQMRQVHKVTRAIAYTPIEAKPFFSALVPDFDLIPQRGADLGQRLKGVVADAFAVGYEHVVAIDSDTVTLPPKFLQEAFEALEYADVSIGGCEDGGYYAIGLRHPYLSVFEVEMSTPHVLRDTLRQATVANLSIHQLPVWYDVDTPADLQRLAQELKGKNSASARYLRSINLER